MKKDGPQLVRDMIRGKRAMIEKLQVEIAELEKMVPPDTRQVEIPGSHGKVR